MLKNKSTFLLIFLLFAIPLAGAPEKVSPAEKKSVNKASFTVSSHEAVSLEGLWKLKLKDSMTYAGSVYNDKNWRFTRVPGNILDIHPGYRGIAWYRACLRFSPGASKQYFVIRLGKISVADEVYFNGNLIGRTGSITSQSDFAFDKTRYYLVPGHMINEESENTLAVRVRGYLNDSFGMIWGTYSIGPADVMHRQMMIDRISEIFFVSLYLFVGIFFAIFSRLPTFLSRQQLYFAFFSFIIAGYLFCIGQVKYLITDSFFPFHMTQYIPVSYTHLRAHET